MRKRFILLEEVCSTGKGMLFLKWYILYAKEMYYSERWDTLEEIRSARKGIPGLVFPG